VTADIQSAASLIDKVRLVLVVCIEVSGHADRGAAMRSEGRRPGANRNCMFEARSATEKDDEMAELIRYKSGGTSDPCKKLPIVLH